MCVSLSGGGIRSAAFSLGILKALYERGMLADVDVISAVSGGTYALSWLVLQPYYAASDPTSAIEPAASALASMFDPAGPFQQYLQKHSRFVGNNEAGWDVFWDATAMNFIRGMFVVLGLNDEVLVNGTGARRLYRERIQRTFHVYPRFTSPRWSTLTEDERRAIAKEDFEATNLLYGFEATNLLQLKPEESSLPGSLWIVPNVTFSDLRRFLSKAGAARLEERMPAKRARRSRLPYPVFNLTLDVWADR
jgi:Patatin-like phospholipase